MYARTIKPEGSHPNPVHATTEVRLDICGSYSECGIDVRNAERRGDGRSEMDGSPVRKAEKSRGLYGNDSENCEIYVNGISPHPPGEGSDARNRERKSRVIPEQKTDRGGFRQGNEYPRPPRGRGKTGNLGRRA